jgi:uncharacterized phosphatase
MKERKTMTFVCFVRHGETDWNRDGRIQGREDIPLNETGLEQAWLVGEYLRNEDWDVLVSSPLQRAKKTAEIIGDCIGIHRVIEMEEFMERGYGLATGMTKEERDVAFPDGNIPERESDGELKGRAMEGLETLLQRYRDRRILVVAHGGVINAILSAVSKGEMDTVKARLDNTGLNRLNYRDGSWMIQDVNVIDHLGVK